MDVDVVIRAQAGDEAAFQALAAALVPRSMRVAHACRGKRAPHHEPTEDEVREVHARGVGERECRIRLGCQPVEPPSVEACVQTYRTGPWLPVENVAWSGSVVRAAARHTHRWSMFPPIEALQDGASAPCGTRVQRAARGGRS